MIKEKHIDIIIPAYKAQQTIKRTMASIAMQTVTEAGEVSVYIVNDGCPNGDYSEIIERYKDSFPITEVKLEKNSGPGVARQKGIEAGESEFFTCIDADDTFSSAIALEIMRAGMVQENPQFPADSIKCVSCGFMQLGEDLKHMLPHINDMVWMFGKLYRRKFIEQYKIVFNETRANEDTGYNKQVQLLCTNQAEQIRFVQDIVYLWHNKNNSITRINDGQYQFDQCFCGWTDNMIYAIEKVRKIRPFDGNVAQMTCSVMLQLYYYWVECYAKKPIFADQDWEYVKKFYHRCYTKIKDDMSDQVLSEMFGMASMEKFRDGSMIGVIPVMGIKEFLTKLEEEEYDEDHIYVVWEQMKSTEEGAQLIQNNIDCGVCEEGYTERKVKKIEVTIEEKVEE